MTSRRKLDHPTVTVLITTYNYGHYIQDAIDSVIAQNFPGEDLEIIVIDDGSTDDTARRVERYGSRVRYFYKTNGGQASALNLGFAKANAEIVCLLDADDLFIAGKISRIVEAFGQDSRLGLVYHRMLEWNCATNQFVEDKFCAISGTALANPERFEHYRTATTSCVSFRRCVLSPLLPIPESIRMNADCFLVALVPFLAPVKAIPEFLTTYRIHGANAYHADQSQNATDVRRRHLSIWERVITEMNGWLDAHGFTPDLPAVRSMRDRWTNLLERESFFIAPPGRIQFFRHLMRSYRYERPSWNWRFRVMNEALAFAALVLGYERYPDLVQYRDAIINSTASARELGK